MAPSPDDGNQAAAPVAVTDASDAPSLPPIATLVSDPRTAFSAKKGRRVSEESCQTAAKSCDRRQVDGSCFMIRRQVARDMLGGLLVMQVVL